MTSLIFFALFSFFHFGTSTATPDNAKPLPKFPAILIFGDSTVDTGNNNYILTSFKANHPPYGQDFPGRIPTGRFSNGKLVPDFVASFLGLKETVPPYLQPDLSDNELLTGVSFASAGSGYDELTTAFSGVIPLSTQIFYFKEYIERLVKIVGEKRARDIVEGALVIISAGTNDFVFNFYDIPTRRLQFNVDQYQDFLQSKIQNFIKELYELGCRKMVVSGLPPIGCLPIQRILKSPVLGQCIQNQNSDAISYNDKLLKLLPRLEETLPATIIAYSDIYTHLLDMLNNPQNHGLADTSRGCCGTGTLEAGPLCNAITPVCVDPSAYVFWDSTHPTQTFYRYFSDQMIKELLHKFS